MVSNMRYRSFFKAYLILISVALVCIGLMNLAERNLWSMGDWVINYSGGFVRRGLIGQFALIFSRITHSNIFFIILVMQWACYAALIWSVWIIVRDISWSFWTILMVYSPATLSIILLNPGASFRKELLFLTILALTIALSKRFKLSGVMGQIVIPVAVFIAVLSHEALALYLPYLLAVYLIHVSKSLRSGLIAFTPTAAAGAIAFLLASKYPGSAADASIICSSVGGGTDPAVGFCRGAIFYLSHDSNFARRDVIDAIHYWRLIYQAPYIIFLATLPIVMGLVELWRDHRVECKIVSLCATLAWLDSILLFIYGFDWDRWVSIHAFSAMLLILMIKRRQPATNHIRTQSWGLPHQRVSRYAACAFIAFMTCGWQCAFTHHFPLPLDKLHDYAKSQRTSVAAALKSSKSAVIVPIVGD